MNPKHSFIYTNSHGHKFHFTPEDVCGPTDFIPPWSFNPHRIRPFILHDEGIAVYAVVFADCLQDALDVAVDNDKLDGLQVDDSDLKGEMRDYACSQHDAEAFNPDCQACMDASDRLARLGNAGEPFDIETLLVEEVPVDKWTPNLWTIEQLNDAIEALEDGWDDRPVKWQDENRARYITLCGIRAVMISE